MQFGMALSDAFLDTIIYFPAKGVCIESKMADEQAMIRRLLNNSLVSIIRELASEILDSDRIDSLLTGCITQRQDTLTLELLTQE